MTHAFAALPALARRAASSVALLALLAPLSSALAGEPACYGVMFRTGGQTSGLGPWLFDVNPATGAATNGRQLNVNIAVGVAIDPATGTMYGLTDQLGRINNQSGTAGKNLLFTINPANGFCTAVGQLDPTNTSSSAPLAVFEGDIEFHPTTGELLIADGDFGGTANLYRFDPKSGTLSLIGPTGVAIGNSNGFAGLEFVPQSAPPCPADLDGDGTVGAADLAVLLGAWGPCS